MKIWKNIPFFVWMLVHLAHIAPIGRRVDKYRSTGEMQRERTEIMAAASWIGTQSLKRFGARTEIWGLERIPDETVLFVSNHQGYGDIFLFLGTITDRQFGFVSKEELFKIPIFGKWIARIRSLSLERGDARETLRVFQMGADWLRQGFSLVIFPEGTRSRSNQMSAFKKGSFRLATKTGTTIVPVSLTGAWRLFEEKGYVRGGDVKFYVHEPIRTAELSKDELADLPTRVEAVIRAKVDEWNGAQ